MLTTEISFDATILPQFPKQGPKEGGLAQGWRVVGRAGLGLDKVSDLWVLCILFHSLPGVYVDQDHP